MGMRDRLAGLARKAKARLAGWVERSKDALRRAVRTFVQTFLGALSGQALLSAVGESGVVDWSVVLKVVVAAAVAGAGAVFALGQNLLEDKQGKAVPLLGK